MERTLDIMMEELRLAEEERKSLSDAIKLANDKIRKTEKEIETYKLNHAQYHPMSELANYKGKKISHIVLVERDENGTLDTEYVCSDEMFSVDNNGHLYYSSNYCGVMHYDETIDKYVKWYHFNKTEHDYIGFLEIELEDDD